MSVQNFLFLFLLLLDLSESNFPSHTQGLMTTSSTFHTQDAWDLLDIPLGPR